MNLFWPILLLCSALIGRAEAVPVRVAAASSVGPALEELTGSAEVELHLGGSGQLSRQLVSGARADIVLNRPERLNAFTLQAIHNLSAAIDEIATDDNIRIVTLRGAGRAFSTGVDLKELPSDGWKACDAVGSTIRSAWVGASGANMITPLSANRNSLEAMPMPLLTSPVP